MLVWKRFPGDSFSRYKKAKGLTGYFSVEDIYSICLNLQKFYVYKGRLILSILYQLFSYKLFKNDLFYNRFSVFAMSSLLLGVLTLLLSFCGSGKSILIYN